MENAITDNRNKRGRPKIGATLVGVRVEPALLGTLDNFIAQQPDKPSRPEAIRRIVTERLLPQSDGKSK